MYSSTFLIFTIYKYNKIHDFKTIISKNKFLISCEVTTPSCSCYFSYTHFILQITTVNSQISETRPNEPILKQKTDWKYPYLIVLTE